MWTLYVMFPDAGAAIAQQKAEYRRSQAFGSARVRVVSTTPPAGNDARQPGVEQVESRVELVTPISHDLIGHDGRGRTKSF
jgi:hypothetical protein